MKKSIGIKLFLCSLFVMGTSSSLFAMSTQTVVMQELHKAAAKDFLHAIQVAYDKETVQLDQAYLIKYLTTRVDSANNILAGDASGVSRELRFLDPNYVRVFTLNLVDHDPNVRVIDCFPQIIENHIIHIRRIRLECRTDDLIEDYEKPYEHLVKRVSEQEYTEKLQTISQDERRTMLFQASRDIAQAIIDALKK